MSLQSLAIIQDEVRQLLDQGVIDRHQPIYMLSRYFRWREWLIVERELEENSFLLRDRIGDLISAEDWQND
jgi:hypothetical protein